MAAFAGYQHWICCCQRSPRYFQVCLNPKASPHVCSFFYAEVDNGISACSPVHITCLLSSKGLLWIGTSIGCVLTLPLPRLEGVPQIKGRPTVAFHAHTGPVKFLSAIHCGASQLPLHSASVASDSCAASESSYDTTMPEAGSHRDVHLDGVTETESATEENPPGFTLSDEFSHFGGMDNCLDDGFAALARNRWISTPDLRDLPMGMPDLDDVQMLYGSLLQDNLEDDLDQELLGPNRIKRRARGMHLGMVANKVNKFSEAVLRIGGSSSSQNISPARFATLPVLREEAGPPITKPPQAPLPLDKRASIISTGENEASTSSDTNSTEGASNESFSTPLNTPVVAHHRTVVPAYPTMVMSYHANTKKALIVVSGGEGHINWNHSHAADQKYEDICLLLWQCRL